MKEKNIVTTDFKEAKNHVDTFVKKKQDRVNRKKERVSRQQKQFQTTTYSQPLTEKGRENYERIFGHD